MTYNLSFEICGAIVLMILIGYVKWMKYASTRKSYKIFAHFLIVALIGEILDITSALTITYSKSLPVWFCVFSVSIYNIAASYTEYYALAYIASFIGKKSKINKWICNALLLAIIILSIINIPTGIIFSFSTREYVHGPLYYIIYLIPFFYIADILYLIIIHKKVFNIRELTATIFFFSFTFAASMLQALVFTDVLLAFFGISISALVMAYSLESEDHMKLVELQKGLEIEVEKQTAKALMRQRQVENLSLQTIVSLANAVDAKDSYTRGHSTRVAEYSKMIAVRLGWDEKAINNIYNVGLLHDIGKIGVPDAILIKPAKLTDEEYLIIKQHPVIGAEMLKDLTSVPNLTVGVRYHHERYDGRGYPEGLSGENIPIIARIIAVADAYDAMTSNRSYRKVLTQAKAKKEIENNKGTQFDPNIADIMLKIIDEDVNFELKQ